MYPPIFQVCSAYAPLVALIGNSPVRLFLFSEAPQNVATPYVVWQTIGGSPENYLSGRPDIDSWSLQIDVYATTAAAAREVARQVRNAIDGDAYITNWRGDSRDFDTRLYRYSFDVEWWSRRA